MEELYGAPRAAYGCCPHLDGRLGSVHDQRRLHLFLLPDNGDDDDLQAGPTFKVLFECLIASSLSVF